MNTETDAEATLTEEARELLLRELIAFADKDPRESLDRPVRLEDFGFDSLKLFNFILRLEEKLNFQIPEHEFTIAHLGTLDGLVEIVEMSKREAAKIDSVE